MKEDKNCTLYCYCYNSVNGRLYTDKIEAVETPKLYRFKEEHRGTYLQQCHKTMIGVVQGEIWRFFIFLTEENKEMAIRKFIGYHENKINGLKAEISKHEAAIRTFVDMLYASDK